MMMLEVFIGYNINLWSFVLAENVSYSSTFMEMIIIVLALNVTRITTVQTN